MNEYRIVTFTQPTSDIFNPEVGAASIRTISFNDSIPQLAEMMDGWEPVNFQLVPNGVVTYVSIMLKANVSSDDVG